jgi:flagellar FliJ protein
MTWRGSLVRIATYEVETLQKRLVEIVERRNHAEMRLVMLEAEVEAEADHAARDPEARPYMDDYMRGVQVRRSVIRAGIVTIAQEEAGARDALVLAFEAQKKFERVAELARVAAVKEAARLDTITLDELGMRASGR